VIEDRAIKDQEMEGAQRASGKQRGEIPSQAELTGLRSSLVSFCSDGGREGRGHQERRLEKQLSFYKWLGEEGCCPCEGQAGGREESSGGTWKGMKKR